MSLEVEKNAKPASKKRGYWGRFIENEPYIVTYLVVVHPF